MLDCVDGIGWEIKLGVAIEGGIWERRQKLEVHLKGVGQKDINRGM